MLPRGATAMTGMRRLTTSLGLLERTPPEQVLSERAPAVLRAAPIDPDATVELAHWTYDGVAGAVFGLLPGALRRHPAAGPLYGLSIWIAFEVVIAPVLGIRVARRRTVTSHLMLAADHLLYGVIVAGELAPELAREQSASEEEG